MVTLYEETSVPAKPVWRVNGIHETNTRGYLLDGENAAGTSFGEVKAGTILALHESASGKVRPSGAAQVDGLQAGVNDILTDGAETIFVGDVVTLYDPDGTVVAAARNVTAVVLATKIVTIDGGVVTAADNGFLLVDGGYIPVGILHDQPDTIRRVAATNLEREHSVTVGLEGTAKTASVIGLTDLTKKMLAGGIVEVATTFDGIPADGQFTSNVAGFLFRS